MKKSLSFLALALALIYLPGCNKFSPVAPEKNVSDAGAPPTRAEQIALELINQSSWAVDETVQMHSGVPVSLAKSAGGQIISFIRQPITGNIVHYAFQVPVGPGPFDVIGIHRVVKEKSDNQPINTRRVFFLQHGDYKDFIGMYLPGIYSSNFPFDFGIAVYLAEKNVDVWGIDQAWTLVPGNQPNCDFLADWGIQKQVDDLNLAISVARVVRKFMGMGFHKVLLSGYSSGVFTGYALLNQETQLPEASRQVAGFIPVDCPFKTDDPSIIEVFANDYNYMQSLILNGQWQMDSPFPIMGPLARTDPDGPSPVFEGFTNLQAALFMGAGQVFGESVVIHYLGGVLENGFPVDLRYTTIPRWLDFMASGPPYLPAQFEAEYDIILSNLMDSPFDDHLAEITVPILTIAAVGGLGPSSVYTTTLLGSTDITNLVVSAGAPSILEEIAHIDIFASDCAERLFWRPMFNWIQAHSMVQSQTTDKFVEADAE